MNIKQQVVERLEGKQAEGMFSVTSVCKDDLRLEFKDDKEALRKIDNMDEGDMKHLASKMADGYCDCCYWDSLRANLESRFLKR